MQILGPHIVSLHFSAAISAHLSGKLYIKYMAMKDDALFCY